MAAFTVLSRLSNQARPPTAGRVGQSVLAMTDEQLQRAADGLLAAVNPNLPSNQHLSDYAKERLRWLNNEQTEGRLVIRFFHDTPENALPGDVAMASTREGGKAVIFLSKRHLAADLSNTGSIGTPFNARQRNDFAIGLIHEIVHLQNPEADPGDQAAHIRERAACLARGDPGGSPGSSAE